MAGLQTAGRGRQGRVWHAPPGRALLFSVLLRPRLDPSAWPGLGSLAGLAVAETCATFSGRPVGTKWPNDVVCGDRKLCGVLVESRAPEFAVLGIGVNRAGGAADFPEELRGTVTTLEELAGVAPPATDLLIALLNRLDELYGLLLAGEDDNLLRRQRAAETTLGHHLLVSVPGGTLEGLAVDLLKGGRLLLRTAAGDVALASGEVQRVRRENGANPV